MAGLSATAGLCGDEGVGATGFNTVLWLCSTARRSWGTGDARRTRTASSCQVANDLAVKRTSVAGAPNLLINC